MIAKISEYQKRKIQRLKVEFTVESERSVWATVTDTKRGHGYNVRYDKQRNTFSCECWWWVNRTLHNLGQPCSHIFAFIVHALEKGLLKREQVERYLECKDFELPKIKKYKKLGGGDFGRYISS